MATISTNIVRTSHRTPAKPSYSFLQAPPLAVLIVAKAPLLGFIATAGAMRICLITRAILFFELRDKEEAAKSIRQPWLSR